MGKKSSFILYFAASIFSIIASDGSDLPQKSICSWMFYRNSTCSRFNFLCSNGRCIDRWRRCDGKNDCGNSYDEEYCRTGYTSCPSAMKRCRKKNTCIINEWVCDGIPDCYEGEDEQNCEGVVGSEQGARVRALMWMNKQKISQSATEMWGSTVDKSAVVLHLAGNMSTNSSQETMKEMAYEVSIQFLSRLSKRKIRDIPSAVLASYLNAFLVTCLDPRKFHGVNVVRELRSRVDSEDTTNPYLMLSLCNAGETITESDIQKLVAVFRGKRREFWTDVQAVAVMALACASRQSGNSVDFNTLRELTLELKQLQYKNGSVENLQTTALVIQALLSAESAEDPDNFDDKKAMQQILAMQEADGSFGSFQNTYYVLPVLNCQSLVNISSDHCETSIRDEKSTLEDLSNRQGPKVKVRYSLWFGDGTDLERNLVLRVPANTSFYAVMELAAEIDSRYRFEYVVKNRRPYVNAISGYHDDPESGTFWFFYPSVDGKLTLSKQSPAEVTANDNDHLVMWYRSESWKD